MKRFLLFVCVLLIQGEAFSESFGVFKKSWSRIPINMTVSVANYTRDYIRTKPDDFIGRPATADILVRSVSFKLINVESKDWKAALQGKKMRHCAVKVDADLRKISKSDKYGYFSLKFFDRDGLLVKPARKLRSGKVYYDDSVSISVSEVKSGIPIKILFMPDESCGAPVRVKVESVEMKSI